ncbi:MAG: efflux RND transporter periplasmic adaptor subunit [Sterolibacterium sp.]
MKNRTFWVTAGILAAGVVLGGLILLGAKPAVTGDAHGGKAPAHAEGEKGLGAEETVKGSHGGRLFSQGDFAVEIAIFEQGVPPEFRVYALEKGKPVASGELSLQLQLERLGAQPETIGFKPEKEFLRSDRTILEPHSFKVTLAANHKGQAYRWTYEQEEGRVRMDDAAAKNAGIEVQTAGPMKISSKLELSGEIQFNQDRLAHVVPRLAGVVVRSAKNLGDQVKKGDVLAVLESQSLADLKSEFLATSKRLELARTTFEREKRLWEDKISAQQDYLAARQALSEAEIAHNSVSQKLLALGLSRDAMMRVGTDGLTRYEIHAPLDGMVIEKHLALGEAVKEDASIFTIADLSTVWAEMTVYPKDINTVKLGQKVVVRAAALNAVATGRVAYVGSLVGEQTRSAKARVTLPNPDHNWRPGLFVTMELDQNEREVPVAVPVGAVQSVRDWKVVFGRYGEFFELRPLELGVSDGKWIEVVKGLPAGTRYAATGSFILKADLGKAGASHDH